MKEDLLKRITMNPKVSFGKPAIRNMRYPVEIMLDLLAAGMTMEEILEDYPDLERDDLLACILFAKEAIRVKSIHKLATWYEVSCRRTPTNVFSILVNKDLIFLFEKNIEQIESDLKRNRVVELSNDAVTVHF